MPTSSTMDHTRPYRIGALSGLLAGLLIALPALVEAFTGETTATSFFLALSPAFSLPLLAALHRRQGAVTGRFGETAYVVNLIGLGLFGGAAFASNLVLFHFDDAVIEETLTGPTIPALIGSAVVFAVGCVLFGAATVRARVFPRVPAWAYATALPLFAFLIALPDSVLTSALHIVVGATLTWLAAALWRIDGATAPRTAEDHATHTAPR
ncbi:hypothetical protein AB0N81_37980 [Streptomyces sp. NPDC093510]|uniref:hypothetical protein n=1 Tax=Streptomyces sp. NPDC093510 TaxID=3155199 RepID=UPI003419FFE8